MLVSQIHIIDADAARRAALRRKVRDLSSRSKVYADYAEFSKSGSNHGLLLIAHDQAEILLDLLKREESDLSAIVYAEQPSICEAVDVMRCGALDFFEWPIGKKELGSVLKRTADSGNQRAVQLRRRAAAKRVVQLLSPRELDVLSGVAAGGLNRDIASDLGISVRTVEIHRANMMRKLNAVSPGDAARIAVYAGLDRRIDVARFPM